MSVQNAVDNYTAPGHPYNCAQAVVTGMDRDDLVAEMKMCGGGRAPEGFCGALHGALAITNPAHRDAIIQEFQAAAGAITCREIKGTAKTSCADCVRIAAELVEKFGQTA